MTPREFFDALITFYRADQPRDQKGRWTKTGASKREQAHTRAVARKEAKAANGSSGGGSGGKAREHGPSKAKVTFAKGHLKHVNTEAHKLFGRKLARHELASLAGAPHNAHVRVEAHPRTGISLSWKSREGSAQRHLRQGANGAPEIRNQVFHVKPEHQGKGIGSESFGRQVEHARKLGVQSLTTHADRGPTLSGYHVWPRMGYTGPIPKPIAERLPKSLGHAKDVADLMRSKAGRAWWKKNGGDVELRFDPGKGSRSSKIWDAYQGQRNGQ